MKLKIICEPEKDRQKIHRSERLSGHSGGEDGEEEPCKEKETGMAPASLRCGLSTSILILGISACAGCTYGCSRSRSIVRIEREASNLCQRWCGATGSCSESLGSDSDA